MGNLDFASLFPALSAFTWQNLVMITVGATLIYLAIKKEYEPTPGKMKSICFPAKPFLLAKAKARSEMGTESTKPLHTKAFPRPVTPCTCTASCFRRLVITRW